jgi:hypothetical protein
MICHAAETREETFANRLDERWLATLRAKDDVTKQRGVGVRHRFQPSLRDALYRYYTDGKSPG